MAFNDVANEGRLTIAMGAWKVELATTIHGAIAVVVGFALEEPLIAHVVGPASPSICVPPDHLEIQVTFECEWTSGCPRTRPRPRPAPPGDRSCRSRT